MVLAVPRHRPGSSAALAGAGVSASTAATASASTVHLPSMRSMGGGGAGGGGSTPIAASRVSVPVDYLAASAIKPTSTGSRGTAAPDTDTSTTLRESDAHGGVGLVYSRHQPRGRGSSRDTTVGTAGKLLVSSASGVPAPMVGGGGSMRPTSRTSGASSGGAGGPSGGGGGGGGGGAALLLVPPPPTTGTGFFSRLRQGLSVTRAH